MEAGAQIRSTFPSDELFSLRWKPLRRSLLFLLTVTDTRSCQSRLSANAHSKFTVVPLRPPLAKNVWLRYITITTASLIKTWQKRGCDHSTEPPLKAGKHDSYRSGGSFSLYLWVSAIFQRDDDGAGEGGTLLSRKPADGKMKSFHPEAWLASRHPCKTITRGFPSIRL